MPKDGPGSLRELMGLRWHRRWVLFPVAVLIAACSVCCSRQPTAEPQGAPPILPVAPQLQVSPPPSLSLIEDIRVTRYEALDLVRVALKVPPFTMHRAPCGTGERTRVLSLYLQCRLQTRLGGPRED